MNRRVMFFMTCVCLYLLVRSSLSFALEHPEREKERGGMGKSLMGLQEGVRGVVGGFFGIGEHTAKFLFYGTSDGFRAVGRGAEKADRSLQKNLW